MTRLPPSTRCKGLFETIDDPMALLEKLHLD